MMIRNANSAIERVRNQFSYKLGQAMIASSKAAEGGGGIIPHNLFI
ncbi:sugar transferase [Helicobacter pullorum]|nr:sugar transferase [Helicobacter pullorum]